MALRVDLGRAAAAAVREMNPEAPISRKVGMSIMGGVRAIRQGAGSRGMTGTAFMR